MHFEVLVEDYSGKIALGSFFQKFLDPPDSHSFRVIAYKGIGKLPPGLKVTADPAKRILLDQLPRLLRGYGKSLQHFDAAVIVVVDLDRKKDCKAFKTELIDLLNKCDPRPNTFFRIAIEELEAWFFGDQTALTTAYPSAKKAILSSYKQDSVCNTWELLADAIHPGGAAALLDEGWPAPGRAKCDWAAAIAPLMKIDDNTSPSFCCLRDLIKRLAS